MSTVETAFQAYEEARTQAWVAYEKAMEVVVQAKKAYEEALAQAWKAYEEARDQAKKKPLLDEAGTAVDLGE